MAEVCIRKGRGRAYDNTLALGRSWIHEHYTSQRCSVCAFEPDKIELPPEQHVQMRPGYDRQDGYKETVHGVRWCPECEITHHRDVNSARNMRKLGIYICMNRSRAPPFRHEGAYND